MKVEVSFQDDFAVGKREYTLMPKYVLRRLHESGIEPKIGDQILLWEKTANIDKSEYYICNIGKIMDARNNPRILAIAEHIEDMAQINNNPIFIEVDMKEDFQLPDDTPVFK